MNKKLKDLLTQSANGDESSFEELLKIIIPILYKDIRRYTDNQNDIDDIMQETIWKIWSIIDKVDFKKDPIAFFRKIAHNTLISYFRKKKKKEVYIPHEKLISTSQTIFSSTQENTEEEIEKLSNKLNTLINLLPENYKIAIKLRFIEEKDYSEIAKQLNTTETNARQLVSRAIKKLKKLAGEK